MKVNDILIEAENIYRGIPLPIRSYAKQTGKPIMVFSQIFKPIGNIKVGDEVTLNNIPLGSDGSDPQRSRRKTTSPVTRLLTVPRLGHHDAGNYDFETDRVIWCFSRENQARLKHRPSPEPEKRQQTAAALSMG